MRAWWIAVLCCVLLGAAPALAQSRTVTLPNNVTRDRTLAGEDFRHERVIENIHDNMRRAEYAHKKRLEEIRKDTHLSGDEKAKRVADADQHFQNQMRAFQRQIQLAEQDHAKREGDIRARYPEPGDSYQISSQVDNENAPLNRARELAGEDTRYDGAVASIDSNRRARDVAHRARLRSIDQGNNPEEVKELDRAEENELYEIDQRFFERQRRLADEEHENRRAAIEARYGGAAVGDVFASQGDPQQQTPPRPPQQGRVEDSSGPGQAPLRGGPGQPPPPQDRPPLAGGVPQTGNVPPPQSRPPVLKGRVEENVGFPQQPPEADKPPCSKEWQTGTPDPEYQFAEGLSDSLARCAEAEWAMMPLAGPVALVASKARFVAVMSTVLARAGGAAALYRDLQKQRADKECAYDTGLWYAQLLCDGRAMATRMPENRSPSPGQLDPVRPVGPRQPTRVSTGPDPYEVRGQAPEPDPPGVVCAVKEDCFWRAMRNATGDPAFEQKFDGPRPSSWQEVHDALKQNFGGKVPGVKSQAHANGQPVRMTQREIVDYMKDKQGAEGIVFVYYTNGGSHALNVANFRNNVVFIDDQKQFWSGNAPRQTVDQALKGKVAYMTFYRTH